jgi:hypothetical protein
MANEHPFQLLFESFGRLPVAHAESVNREAYDELGASLDEPVNGSGRCILLRAPRAGHGKTHLLSRIQHQLGGTHEFIPLQALGSRIDALSVTEDTLKRLSRPLAGAGGLTVLDLVVRRLFAYALQPLVTSGEVPCQDREAVLAALKSRPLETFDFHHPGAVTAHWAKENFELLGPRLSLELANRTGVSIREVSFWVNAFFRFASTPIEHPGRTSLLGLEVTAPGATESIAMERLVVLLGLLSLLSRVVLVADELEGFSADESAALKFAAFITTIRQSVDRVDVILSLNKDVWENAFLPRLSGGLVDRLSEVLIELEPLGDEDIVALFDSRVPGLGAEVLERVTVSERHARGLIRAAGKAWTKAQRDRQTTAAPAVAAAASEPGAIGQPDAYHEAPAPAREPEPVVKAAPEPVFIAAPVFERQPPAFAEPQQLPRQPEPVVEQPAALFQAAPVYFDEPVAEPAPVFQAVEKQPEPQRDVADFEESGFARVMDWPQPAADETSPFQAVKPQIPSGFPATKPAAITPEPRIVREDDGRVDDLLRQFRERYGRGGL